MCRAVAYLGPPIRVSDLLHTPDNSLVAQSYDPQQLHMLNLAGFGLTAWPHEPGGPGEPLEYKTTVLPVYDRNLASLAHHVKVQCMVGHVRGIAYRQDAGFGAENLHPFRYAGERLALAHNGDLAGFASMRVALLRRIDPEISIHMRGTTDSEFIYAVFLTEVRRLGGSGDGSVLVDALEETIRVLRDVRAAHGIAVSSSMNLFVSDGDRLVILRYTFDFGRYPLDPAKVHEANSRYLSLWYTVGRGFERTDGGYRMADDDGRPLAAIAASEPLTRDLSGWVEVPEYSALVIERVAGRLRVEAREIAL